MIRKIAEYVRDALRKEPSGKQKFLDSLELFKREKALRLMEGVPAGELREYDEIIAGLQKMVDLYERHGL